MPRLAIDNIHLNYEITGHGEPLVLLHGLGSRLQDWCEQTAYFSKHYQVIAIDCRGHGNSDKPDTPYSIPIFTRDITLLLNKLGVDRFHLAGFSMGGMIAFQFAVDQPQRLISLTIINSSPRVPCKTLSERMEVGLRLVCIRLLGMERLGRLIGQRLFPEAEQRELYDEFVSNMKRNDRKAYIHSLKSFLGWDVSDQLQQLTMPVLVISGDQDYTPINDKQQYCQQITNCLLQIISNSRHATPLDQPEALNHVMEKFLRATDRQVTQH